MCKFYPGGYVTAFEAVVARADIFSRNEVQQLREDHDIGFIKRDIGDYTHVGLQPLTWCEDAAEIGCVRKLFERSGIAMLMATRKRKRDIPSPLVRQARNKLELSKVASTMQVNARDLKGPLHVVYVQKISVARAGEGIRTLLAVVFTREGKEGAYGYFFHLKVGLKLCGFRI